MDNVLNRPLFRHREARDRLNDIAGVQRFNVGGYVAAGSGNPDLSGGSRAPKNVYADPSGALMPQYRRAPIRPEGLPSLPQAETVLEDYFQFGGLKEAVAQAQQKLDRAQFYYEQNPSGETIQSVADAKAELDSLLQEQSQFNEEYLPPVVPQEGGRDVLAVEGPESLISQLPFADQQKTLDIFNSMERAAVEAAPPKPAPVVSPIPGGASQDLSTDMGFEARRGRVAPAAPADRRSTMEADARDRGPLVTSPADVAAGLNAEDPAVRERTLADFMQEFTAAAPEYEGTNKNLMLAQIGFAIAAGESPDAMQNIANGLLAGSEAMIKDKAAKAEFDRQLKLSAMQYGLQETGKQRARAEQALSFVALEDTVYKGRKVKAGTPVYIPYGEIEKNGGVVPSGFGDSSTVTAINERAKAVVEALEEARKENLLDDTFAESQREKFSRAASTAISAERGLGYMESAILKVAEDGNITGLEGTADNFVAKVAAAAGLSDVNAQFNNREEVQGLVKKAFQNLIPAALSGVQTANSISNRDIEILADAYVNSMLEDGVFSMATITEDKLLNSMKGAVDLLESERQQSLVDMRTIEGTLVDRTLRSGAEGTSLIEPYRELLPGQGAISQPRRLGSLVYGEDGIYEIVRPGN